MSGNFVSASAGPGATANADGGGIDNRGTMTVERSTLSGNTVSAAASTTGNSASGGAITNANAASVNVTIDRSTISGNTASADAPGAARAAGSTRQSRRPRW